jgi:hypothetical protein
LAVQETLKKLKLNVEEIPMLTVVELDVQFDWHRQYNPELVKSRFKGKAVKVAKLIEVVTAFVASGVDPSTVGTQATSSEDQDIPEGQNLYIHILSPFHCARNS